MTDSFGIQWMIDYELKPGEREEIESQTEIAAHEDSNEFSTPPPSKPRSRTEDGKDQGASTPVTTRNIRLISSDDGEHSAGGFEASTGVVSGTRSGKRFKSCVSFLTPDDGEKEDSPVNKKLKL